MRHCHIQSTPIDLATIWPALTDPSCGGQAIFIGVVREEFEGRLSVGLDYDAYIPLAEKIMDAIAQQLEEEFGARQVVMVHRIGSLRVGEPSVVVAIAAPHRAEALAACKAGIDRLKAQVPIFKRELWADGSGAWHGEPGGPPVRV